MAGKVFSNLRFPPYQILFFDDDERILHMGWLQPWGKWTSGDENEPDIFLFFHGQYLSAVFLVL